MTDRRYLYHYGVFKAPNQSVTPACWPARYGKEVFDGKTINAVTINRGNVTCLDCLQMMGVKCSRSSSQRSCGFSV